MITNPILSDEFADTNAATLVQNVIVTLINVLYVVGAVGFFFMLVIGGIQWLSSGGDQQKVANARARIQHAVIGLTILMAAFAIVRFIEAAFGVDILLINVRELSLGGGSSGSLSDLGGPCESNSDCIGGLQCIGGACRESGLIP